VVAGGHKALVFSQSTLLGVVKRHLDEVKIRYEWNPAVESQAIDRTHRIGQSRAVSAYRLIGRDTFSGIDSMGK